MAENNFATCLAHTLEFEGGYSNHPSDPGGATMRGVTQRVYDDYRAKRGSVRQGVQFITDAELRDIYRVNYWDRVDGDKLPAGVDLATFDFAVNSGPARANQARAALRPGATSDPVDIVQRLCRARLAFVEGLSTFGVFGRGWVRRITTIEARAVKMAMDAARVPIERSGAELARTGRDAASAAKKQGAGAAGTGGTLSYLGQWPENAWVAVILALAAMGAIWLAYHAYVNWRRAQAYAAVAKEG